MGGPGDPNAVGFYAHTERNYKTKRRKLQSINFCFIVSLHMFIRAFAAIEQIIAVNSVQGGLLNPVFEIIFSNQGGKKV
jgi:hypothetical protein